MYFFNTFWQILLKIGVFKLEIWEIKREIWEINVDARGVY